MRRTGGKKRGGGGLGERVTYKLCKSYNTKLEQRERGKYILIKTGKRGEGEGKEWAVNI